MHQVPIKERMMKTKGTLNNEIKNLIIGISVLCGISFAVSLFWGFRLDYLFGTIIGLLFSCLNMSYLAYTVTRSAGMSQQKAKRYLSTNYFFRYLVFGIIFAISVYSKYINTIAVTLPLFFPRLVLAYNLFILRKEEK